MLDVLGENTRKYTSYSDLAHLDPPSNRKSRVSSVCVLSRPAGSLGCEFGYMSPSREDAANDTICAITKGEDRPLLDVTCEIDRLDRGRLSGDARCMGE